MTMTRESQGAGACFELVSGEPRGDSAIAMIEVRGEVEAALRAAGIRAVSVGGVALRDLAGIDQGVVARWGERCCTIMAHAGPEIVRSLLEHLECSGLRRAADDADIFQRWCEAGSLIEARMLGALARTESTLGVRALLAQPGAWAKVLEGMGASADDERAINLVASTSEVRERSRVMNRLINPPRVAAIGRANIGKSSLVNALAGRAVALSANQAGTTRDHVGVTLDLGGLVVRWLDLPGMTPGQWAAAGRAGDGQGAEPGDEAELEEAARAAAVRAALAADLLVLCGDAEHPAFEFAEVGEWAGESGVEAAVVRVHLRADLGVSSAWASDVRVSVSNGAAEGLRELVGVVRELLVPRGVMAGGAAWRFW